MPRPPRRKPLKVHRDETPTKPIATRSAARSAEKSTILAPSPLKQNRLPRAPRTRNGEKIALKPEVFANPVRETRATRGKKPQQQQEEELAVEDTEKDAPENPEEEPEPQLVRKASPAMLSRTNTLNINEWTPSVESTPVKAGNVLAESTPLPRGKKRKSGSAFGETLLDSLKKIREEPVYMSSPPSAQPETRKVERLPTGVTEHTDELIGELPQTTNITTDEDDSINFNYSSSPPRSISEPPVLLDRDIHESSDTELSDTEVDVEVDELEEEQEPPTPAKNTRSATAKVTKKPIIQPITQPTQPTTADLQSLMPKRRKPAPKTRRKSAKNSKILKPVATTTPRRTSPRKALKDVTSSIVIDDDLDDLDNPALQLGELEDDVQIYVDSSISSSPLSSPPPSSPYGKKQTTTSRPKRGAAAAQAKQPPKAKAKSAVAKGKQRADLAEMPDKSINNKTKRGGNSGRKVTYTRQNSNKENAVPSGGVVDTDVWSDGENDGMRLDKKGTQELNKMKEKFEEVDKWGLEFEDVSPRSSSDGVVKGGR